MTRPLIAVFMAIAVWILLLSGLVIRSRIGSITPPWRSIFLVALGVVILAVGCWLVWKAAEHLAGAGISPFAAHAGPVLVTDGIYGRVRNPMDLGNTLVALSPAVAIDVAALWILPVAALLYYAGAQAPLENHFLRERFKDRFEEYKGRVPSWTPLWK